MSTRNDVSGQAGPGTLVVVSILSVAALVFLIHLNAQVDTDGADASSLVMYCAAGIRAPVQRIADAYEEEYGVKIELNYAGSGTLLSNLRIARRGDLYLAADDSYIDQARQLGLADEAIQLAWIKPVVAVAAGNPKGVRRLDDLLRDDVKVGLANPDAAAVGRATRSLMRGLGRWKALATKAHVMKPTVESLVNDLKLGAVDVAVLWDATVGQYEELDIADIPELADGGERQVTVGVLDSSEVPAAALRFARYLGARDRGLATFQSGGFRVVNGDPWAVRPRLVIYSGAMLRPGISATLEDFQRREACEIETVYNGCGVLVASMANARIPDAYLACDTSFMDQVADRFLPATLLTENDLVILVKRGNPDAVKTLEDLAREGLRVGLAHVQNSALGALTKRLLESLGLWGRVVKNRAVDSATGDFLVNQIIAGRLDAVVVYRSNALAHPGNAERLEIVDLDGELAYARQSWAVAKDARYPQLLGRLFDRVHRGGTRARFRSVGFRWIGPKR